MSCAVGVKPACLTWASCCSLSLRVLPHVSSGCVVQGPLAAERGSDPLEQGLFLKAQSPDMRGHLPATGTELTRLPHNPVCYAQGFEKLQKSDLRVESLRTVYHPECSFRPPKLAFLSHEVYK